MYVCMYVYIYIYIHTHIANDKHYNRNHNDDNTNETDDDNDEEGRPPGACSRPASRDGQAIVGYEHIAGNQPFPLFFLFCVLVLSLFFLNCTLF